MSPTLSRPSLLSCVLSNLGKQVSAPGGLGGECVDWANVYLGAVWGVAPIRANAAAWAGIKLPNWSWIANLAGNAPRRGSLAVWLQFPPHGIGPNGHIAVVERADTHTVLSWDQNWPDGSPVHLELHDYGGLVGWWQPPMNCP